MEANELRSEGINYQQEREEMIGMILEREINNKERLLKVIESSCENDSLIGRKKLMKLMFFIKYFDFEKKSLETGINFGDFNFIIYNYGPFSLEVMNKFDELKKEGLIKETKFVSTGHKIELTKKGKEKLKEIEEKMSGSELSRIKQVSQEFGSMSGRELEKKSLEYLNITQEDKPELIGTPVEVVISENLK